MIDIDAEEFNARFRGLRDGPWLIRAKPVLSFFSAFSAQFDNQRRVQSGSLFGEKAQYFQENLPKVLRHHIESEITDPAEISFRDALDEALTYPQLAELAIETGYVPEKEACNEVRDYLKTILWVDSVNKFIKYYGYTSVENIAARAGVEGFEKIRPPKINEHGAPLFSAFLATFRQIESDAEIISWFDFLDDYDPYGIDHESFYMFLDDGRGKPPKNYARLLLGAHSFVIVLSDFFRLMPSKSIGQYGSFYAYWLAKFFGFTVVKKRYVRNKNLWGASDSWALTIKKYFYIASQVDSRFTQSDASLFGESIDVLEHVWRQTRAHLQPQR